MGREGRAEVGVARGGGGGGRGGGGGWAQGHAAFSLGKECEITRRYISIEHTGKNIFKIEHTHHHAYMDMYIDTCVLLRSQGVFDTVFT